MDNFGRRPAGRPGRPVRPAESRTVAPQPAAPSPVASPSTVASQSTGAQSVRSVSEDSASVKPAQVVPQPIEEPSFGSPKKKQRSGRKVALWVVGGLLALTVLALGSVFAWYSMQLRPVDAGDTSKIRISITSGSGPSQIAAMLEEKGVIRNKTAFLWHARLEGVQNKLQAGAYALSPSESTPAIMKNIIEGVIIEPVDITFYPGATLVDNTPTPSDKKLDITTVLRRAGFSDEDIKAGLEANYSEFNNTLFQGRPSGQGLEGYVYGDTYRIAGDATVESIIRTSLEHFWQVVEAEKLVAAYSAQGLTLYQGITLASVVQREASPKGDDMGQIAQVFYTRLARGIVLGSDVTYQYIADKTGVARTPNLDSPYNTRKYPGLPPGPISAPGKKALIATAHPAVGDYVYFLSGDDDITYFGKTLDQHEANIRNHCQKKCTIL